MRTDYTGGKELGTWTFLKRDMLFHVALSGIVIMWLVFAFVLSVKVDDPATYEDESLSEEAFRVMVVIFWAFTTAFLGLIGFRYRLISRLVRGGVEVPGKVVRLKPASQGMIIMTVSYRFGGKEIEASKSVGGLLPKLSAKPLREGQEVSLLVNDAMPERYIILDLYLKPS